MSRRERKRGYPRHKRLLSELPTGDQTLRAINHSGPGIEGLDHSLSASALSRILAKLGDPVLGPPVRRFLAQTTHDRADLTAAFARGRANGSIPEQPWTARTRRRERRRLLREEQAS